MSAPEDNPSPPTPPPPEGRGESDPSPSTALPQGEEEPRGEPEIGEELARIPYEPLLPVEKKLIVYSLLLGAALLGILVWLSYKYF